MKFNDQLSFIFQHVKKSKLRITMTILATTIGCAFLIVLASVGFGVQETLESEILSNETVTEIEMWGDTKLSDDQRASIEKVKHVNTVLEEARLEGYIEGSFEDRQIDTNGKVIEMKALEKLPSNLEEGRLPTAANEIVVGYHFGQFLLNEADRKAIELKSKKAEQEGTWYNGSDEGYKGNLIGQTVELKFLGDSGEEVAESNQFTIVGVNEAPPYEFATDGGIYFHEGFYSLYPTIESYPSQKIYVDTAENVMPVLKQLKEEGYQVYSVLEQLEEMDVFFLIFKIGLIFIGTIAVLIASIGIFNTMTMAVTERTREIGILKSIGATPALIQRLFLMESLFIGLVGTVLAVAISYAISILANAILPYVLRAALSDADISSLDLQFSTIPLSLVLIASFISLFVAILSGWRPARKATRVEVIKALQQM